MGLRTRGVTLAQRLAAKITRIDGATLPVDGGRAVNGLDPEAT